VKESKDSGVYVKGLNAFVVKSVPELQNVLAVSDDCFVVAPRVLHWSHRVLPDADG